MSAFLIALFILLGTAALGWIGWVTIMLLNIWRVIDQSAAAQDERLNSHEVRIRTLESLFPRRIPHL